ncbi:ABC transporter substrate-binding protein [Paenibacillus arenilitoris]|uniref:Sugar ABC transporter substrate-binding protein n=1 Tax=Paenibacillus arenilitoris TaxID=2772299 RepID=A0A927H4A2_9BACL|nr:sugar ABC transporter substrate-binding protein [Paenibacillus arenilitoris]MBD2867167.1 sugar ABC transporter substrate-binding protein [Paenibacillus arenilitoris]
MKRLGRSPLPAVAAILFALAAAGCGLDADGGAGSGEAPRPFEGHSITLVTGSHPWADVIKPLLPRFEAETGMSVRVQSFFEDQLTQKLTVQFTSGSETPDVFMYRPLQEGKLFYRNGWLQPLDGYAGREADYDLSDFTPQSLRSSTVDGVLTGIPIITEQGILYYRKDLLREAGIPVPRTLEELADAAGKLHRPEKGVYGFVARGQRSPLVTQVSSFLYSEGGDFTSGSRATINTPEAVKAFTMYGSLLRDYGPPGAIHMSWPQASSFFAEGRAALYTDANSIYKMTSDPARSEAADQVGYAAFPAGSKGSRPYNITSWGLAVNAKSADKEAAWAFIEWATGKTTMLQSQRQGIPSPRSSLWNTREGTAGFPAQLAEVFKRSLTGGVDHDRPTTVNVAEAREPVGEIVQKVMTGETDIQKTADAANAALQAILDKEAE